VANPALGRPYPPVAAAAAISAAASLRWLHDRIAARRLTPFAPPRGQPAEDEKGAHQHPPGGKGDPQI
jgi:hypothetical protein